MIEEMRRRAFMPLRPRRPRDLPACRLRRRRIERCSRSTGSATTAATTTAAVAKTVTITVKNAAPSAGSSAPRSPKGDEVVLVVHSDVADEIHVHGYT